ncbi:polysaccharide lyase [Actinomycetospora termitidis]|uniref:Polysaccharide lyase n=1 Tax=Actinomycetospora termitidis TaxID=3053470 RepID=A0ABT7M2N3_9PSEU|nr:polysaccharide lyase [Actinomycetospora sp. Odt1-22]MDL5154691.1 polysaccharide lyase [Actinomycetospora sp. Odt1-22]
MRAHGVLGAAVSLLLVAGVVVGCSTDEPGTGSSTGSGSGVTATDAPPPLTGAPDPATVPPPIWQASLSGPDPLRNFRDTPYNNDGAPAPRLVDAPEVDGAKALEFTVPGGGRRSELEPNTQFYREGDEAWFGFAWNLPDDFPVNAQGWQVLAQWKNSGDGSPPIEVKVEGGQFKLDGGAGGEDPGGNYFSVPIGPALTGRQTDIVVHIRFSTDPTKASVDVWQNGQQRLTDYKPPGGTRYEGDDSYLKTGIYRDSAISETANLFLMDARIANSYESASALVGPKS